MEMIQEKHQIKWGHDFCEQYCVWFLCFSYKRKFLHKISNPNGEYDAFDVTLAVEYEQDRNHKVILSDSSFC